MIKQGFLSVALAASVGLFSSLAVQAQTQEPMKPAHPGMEHAGHGGWDHSHMAQHHLKMMLKVVGATQAQRDSVKQIVEAARQDMKSQHQAARDLHQEGLALFTAAKLDPAAIEAHRQKAMALQEAISKRRTQMRMDIANVFSPEQRSRYAAWVQEHAGKEMHHHG
jgi:Spy/CpxP family protein refolding chaperone